MLYPEIVSPMKLRSRQQFWWEDFDGCWNLVVDCYVDGDCIPEIDRIRSEGPDGWADLPMAAISPAFLAKIEGAIEYDYLYGGEEYEWTRDDPADTADRIEAVGKAELRRTA